VRIENETFDEGNEEREEQEQEQEQEQEAQMHLHYCGVRWWG
jgi:hypothetical protein